MSASTVRLELPIALAVGLPIVAALVFLLATSLRRRGLPPRRAAVLIALRAGVLLVLVLLAARPVSVSRSDAGAFGRQVVVLVDRSSSMSLESPESRFSSAVSFARREVLPALKNAQLASQILVFADDVELSTEEALSRAPPDGRKTNLGRAVSRALATSSAPPLAIVALTDGNANESGEDARALSALVDANVPLFAVGFGSDRGVATLSLRELEVPAIVAPRSPFELSVQLVSANVDEPSPVDLLLLRDGKLLETRTVSLQRGTHFFREPFRLTEKDEGAHDFEARLIPPAGAKLLTPSTSARAAVRVSLEKELRILYVQGALTWDYKFLTTALRTDPAMKVTGLTRTSETSLFRQNVESAGELLNGFPTSLAEMAPFRVVVLESLKPSELTREQQELLARYCGELGGGILLIGGASTFDSTWQGSRLEQLLPVVIASGGGAGNEQPFRLDLTEEALKHPVFRITDGGSDQAAWRKLPTFTRFGRVDSAKPGAEVWARHDTESGPHGRRILMAAQRYGAGLSAVVCVENLWRWRLAKDSDPAQFDRFWRQLFRYLAEASRQEVAIQVTDAELRPGSDVHLVLERQPNPKSVTSTASSFRFHVEDATKRVLVDEAVDLVPSRGVNVSFRAEKAGLYGVSVRDPRSQPVATRAIEVREVDAELLRTGRNMELLTHWAALTDGVAKRSEECRSGRELVAELREKADPARRRRVTRQPLGINGWVLGTLICALGAEWLLRREWGLP